jgi:hypothetical protein
MVKMGYCPYTRRITDSRLNTYLVGRYAQTVGLFTMRPLWSIIAVTPVLVARINQRPFLARAFAPFASVVMVLLMSDHASF